MTEDPLVAISRALGQQRPFDSGRTIACYVALGDSFTAGTGCPSGLNWADRIASALGRRNPGFVYRNLAAAGATSVQVLECLRPALQLEPDLVTVICGANDILQSTRPSPRGYARRLARIFDRLRGAVPGIIFVTATSPERWDYARMGPRTCARVAAGMSRLNELTRRIADAYAVPCLDVAGHPGLGYRDNFASDGLHPSIRGHARTANAVAQLLRNALGIAIADPDTSP